MARGNAAHLSRGGPGRGQDLRHARRGPAPCRAAAPTSSSASSRPTAGVNTQAQVRDLEIVPRRKIEYRGTRLRGDGRRRDHRAAPEVALVDELAHTNVPGSRNEKRWQDVDELLDAGIDVISTVNIQHLESINDVVEEITGVKQQETVPDAVVRAADQIELVDMTPESLRRRMAHGNVYPAEKVDAALANYFRVRQPRRPARARAALAGRPGRRGARATTASKHGIAGTWETRERVVVAITGAPGGHDVCAAGRADGRAHAGPARRRARAAGRRPARASRARRSPSSAAARGARGYLPRGRGSRHRHCAGRVRPGRERHADRARCKPPSRWADLLARVGDQRRHPGVGHDRRARHLVGAQVTTPATLGSRPTEPAGRRRSRRVAASSPGLLAIVAPLLTSLVLAQLHGTPDAAERPAPLPARGRGGRRVGRHVARARVRDLGLPARELLLHAAHARVHGRRRREPPRARHLHGGGRRR